ncbi:hypothetical protein A5721_01400 [Mycobacterium vulneris]|nr:hypothetical protein A5721_01400 [Mycolicibacterium vulneris]
MPTAKELRKFWDQRIKDEATARGLKSVSGFVYRADAGYVAVLVPIVGVDRLAESVQLTWRAEIKPLALDEILWAAFMPDQDLGGSRKRLNLRVTGAFTVSGLDIGAGSVQALPTADPGAVIAEMLDEFDRLSVEFIAGHPDIDAYLAAVQALPAAQAGWPRNRLREIVTLIAVGDRDAAIAVADAEVAAGEQGPMSGPRGGVFELLSVSCKPPEVQAEYWARNKHTHRLTFVSGTRGPVTINLAAGREKSGAFDRHLRGFNGHDNFALILTPIEDEDSYVQAAGSGPDRITVEIRKRAEQQWGVEWVRSVIGRPGSDGAALDHAIELPTSIQMVSADEVFEAAEAAELFGRYYRTGAIPERYVLRPVEGWTADDTIVRLG